MKNHSINKLLNVMIKLRDPNKGCPWDKKQTFESIIPHTIEEVYEVAEQVYKKDYNKIKDELGDLLFQIIFLSQIAKEKKIFTFNDVVKQITDKMIFRHPHVFKNKKFKNMKDFNNWWEESKNKNLTSLLDDIPNNYPEMLKSNKIQKKVAKVGFEYKNDIEALDKVIEEANELKKEIKKKNKKRIQEELGDMLFASLDVARKLQLNPEISLAKSNEKFSKRWRRLEQFIINDKKEFNDLNLKDFNYYWNKAKIN